MRAFKSLSVKIFILLSILNFANPGWAQTQPLRASADQREFHIGAAVAMSPFRTESTYFKTLQREFNIVVAENAFKWNAMRPTRTTFNFTDSDALVEFALANKMKIRGHTLVWHRQLPGWLTKGTFTRDEVIELLSEHINTFVGRYRGKIWAWDVVNEAIDDETGDYRTTSFWYQHLGADYIKMAFEFAHQADPQARLYYNDYSIEGMDKKSDAVFNLIKNLKAQGVPIDGVGWQMHQINGFRIQPEHQANAKRLAELGLEISMTEMDVRIPLPTSPEKFQQQALAYQDAVRFCLSEANCKALVTWGFSDKYSWIPSTFTGTGDALIFDNQFQPKPAYFALKEILEQDMDLKPVIINATKNGKQLVLTGIRFLENAQLFINGEKQKVRSDENQPLVMLIAPKAGKRIKSGDRIHIKNPDGLISNEFVYP